MRIVLIVLMMMLFSCGKSDENKKLKVTDVEVVGKKDGILEIYRLKTDSGTYLISSRGGIIKE
jgi:hypothetical protein